jgi:[NiFe] hydrogenase diaphorase moiety large subunit
MSAAEMHTRLKTIVDKHSGDPTELLAILEDAQDVWRQVTPDMVTEGTATFYHFLSHTHAGRYTVYVNTSMTAEMAGLTQVIETFEHEVGIVFGTNTADDAIGLRTTSCIGMSDQEPALLINGTVFTRVTPARVRELVAGMRAATPVRELVNPSRDGNNALPSVHAEVTNNIRLKGPVFFTDYEPGAGLEEAMTYDSLDVLEVIKKSGLRGRGGAGFPTGAKWGFCRAADGETRYLMCNADEGEPGTFKDRVLLTEMPELVFEGMAIAGFAMEATQGIVYLRGEYAYLREHLEATLAGMRSRHLLGRGILGTRFHFDIRIKQGAGAYICGEESALLDSSEGKRGQPRNRPPYPATSGYLREPTNVNNPETYACAVKIMLHGADWFRAMGTAKSSGVKLLSIAGDCARPGIYEVEWGKTVREVLALCGAENVMAVQVSGPSGECLSEKQFDRRLCYEDLSTGGAITIFSHERDLLSVVHNHMKFFQDESCGFCVPCRAGNHLLVRSLEKIMAGNGTAADVTDIQRLSHLVMSASRCGLGQTSPHPLLTTIANFPEAYAGRVRKDVDYTSQFDLAFAIADSNAAAKRAAPLASPDAPLAGPADAAGEE